MKREATARRIIISLLGFIALWTLVTDAWGYSARLFAGENGAYVYGFLSRLVWVLPAVLLIVRRSDCLMIPRGQLFSRPRLDRPLALALSVSLIYCLLSMLAAHGESDYDLLLIG